MLKKILISISLFLFNINYVFAAGDTQPADQIAGSNTKLQVFGTGYSGKIYEGVHGIWDHNKGVIWGTLFYLSIAMIITVMMSGVFNYQENIMKSVLKVLVTLAALGVVVFWAGGL